MCVRGIGAALATLIAASTAGCKSPAPELLWSYELPGAFAEADFAASLFSREVVLVSNRPDSAPPWMGLKALDPSTGALRWETDAARWVLHPPGAPRPLFVVNPSSESGGGYREAVELDPATGKTIRHVAFARAIDDADARFVFAGERLLFLARGDRQRTLGAIDPATGAIAWERPSDADPMEPPVVLADRVVFQGSTYIAHAVDDGRELFRVQGTCCAAIASPDGQHLYVRAAVDRTAEVLPDGRLGASLAGEPAAVSDRFVAVQSSGLAVYPHGSADAVHTIVARDPDYVSAVALADDQLFYFRGGDDKLWQVDLGSGKARAIDEIGATFSMGPHAGGSAAPHLGAPPVFDAPLLFVLRWKLLTYRLP